MGIYSGRRSSCLNRWPPNWKLKLKNWPRASRPDPPTPSWRWHADSLPPPTSRSLETPSSHSAIGHKASSLMLMPATSPKNGIHHFRNRLPPLLPTRPLPRLSRKNGRNARRAGHVQPRLLLLCPLPRRLLPLGPAPRIDHAPPLTSRRATRHALRSGRRQLREGHRTAPGNGRRSVERIDRRAAPRKRPGSGSPNTCRRGAPSVAKNRGTGSVTPADALWATSRSTRPAYGNRDRAVKRPRVEWPTSE